MEEHEDLLMELVSTSSWKAVKREVADIERGLIARLSEPIQHLEDLVRKEGHASRLAALRDFINEIERKADRRAKEVRRPGN